jgi:hypothetical protein
MHYKEWSKSIKGVDDVELNIPRANPLAYHCAAPAGGKADGLLFLIADLGEDVTGENQRQLRAYLAQKFSLLVVGVEYHCLRTKLQHGAQLDIGPQALETLRSLCMQHGLALLDPKVLLQTLAKLPVPYEFEVRVVPANGEYQNLGVMQTLDHLAVLQDLCTDEAVSFDAENIIAMGGGYGGYLAHLIAKFAPNTLRAVFDYASMVEAPRSYLFGGQEDVAVPYYYYAGKTRLIPLVITHWTEDSEASNWYSPARHSIRHAALEAHVQTAFAAMKRHTQYRIVTPPIEDATSYRNKSRQAEMLANAGFDVVFQPAKGLANESERNDMMDSGYAARLSAMFERLYPSLASNPGKPDHMLDTSIAYFCNGLIYGFEHGARGCSMNVTNLDSVDAGAARSYRAPVVYPRFKSV